SVDTRTSASLLSTGSAKVIVASPFASAVAAATWSLLKTSSTLPLAGACVTMTVWAEAEAPAITTQVRASASGRKDVRGVGRSTSLDSTARGAEECGRR